MAATQRLTTRFPSEHEGDAKGVIAVTLSARNLSKPLVSHFKVGIEREPGDLEEVVRDRPMAELGVELQGTG